MQLHPPNDSLEFANLNVIIGRFTRRQLIKVVTKANGVFTTTVISRLHCRLPWISSQVYIMISSLKSFHNKTGL